jgi:hypothetical protein
MFKEGKKGLTDIYVVGCGPSLVDFRWSILADKTTIAVNGSVVDVPQPDIFVTADSSFAGVASKVRFWGVDTYKVLVMRPDHKRYRWVKPYLHLWNHCILPSRFNGEIGFSESDFATGQSSGFCGMQLAVILGAKNVHLLGMDFCSKGVSNYHQRYASYPSRFDEFLLHFKTAVAILERHDIKVISHSRISKLNDVIEYRSLL